ncbi:MAG: hypothetical protein DRJ66_05875 [Thermoprotei archaeon]|nr:MAG: hypothetical protein DRJ66_05875 [Thermoprotei archaeon]RLF17468.1 MAG: hypothetical protein DRZ82_09780 [Thermoprotei archaeon]
MTSTLNVFVKAFATVFTAELGDKTMLATSMIVTMFKKVWLVLLASLLAYVTANALPLLALAFVVNVMSTYISLIRIIVGLGFTIIGALFLLTKGKEERINISGHTSVLSYYILVMLSELGDKTQLATIGVAAETGNVFVTFISGSLGYLMANLMASLIVIRFSKRVKFELLRMIAGIVFVIIGIMTLIKALG